MWRAGAGLFAWARATGDARPVDFNSFVPWPAPERYKYVFPIEVLADLDVPVLSSWKQLDALAGLGGVPTPQFPPVADDRLAGVQGLFSPSEAALRSARATSIAEEQRASLMDLTQDRRLVVEATVRLRQGQPAFRQALLRAYNGRCAVTGCSVEPTLQAAHISPYLGTHTNIASNGLLLRADVHTLFDLHLVTIEVSGTIRTAPVLAGTPYADLGGGSPHSWPAESADRPSPDALTRHHGDCSWY